MHYSQSAPVPRQQANPETKRLSPYFGLKWRRPDSLRPNFGSITDEFELTQCCQIEHGLRQFPPLHRGPSLLVEQLDAAEGR